MSRLALLNAYASMKRTVPFRRRVSSWLRNIKRQPTEATATAIYRAAKTGDATKLEELLLLALDVPERRNLINAEDSKGKTPLVVAVSRGHITCVIMLLTHGADIHHMGWSPRGGTALHEAVNSWKPKNMISLLLRNGANPFVENVEKLTPWDMTFRRRDASLFREFEELGKFRDYLLFKVLSPEDGRANWVRRWITVIPRFAGSRVSGEQQYLSTWLLVFEDTTYFEPYFQVKIDHVEAVLQRSEDVGMEVVLTPFSSDVVDISRFLVFHNGKGRMFLSGSEKALMALVKAVKGEDAINVLMENSKKGPSYEEDAELAKRLQAEINRGLLQYESNFAAQSSSSNGAGPSTSASAPPEDVYVSPTVENGTGHVVAGSSSQSIEKQPERDRGDLCIVCLDAPKSAGFAHGNSVHWCVCKKCAQRLWGFGDCCCPLCRMSVDNIITDFYAN